MGFTITKGDLETLRRIKTAYGLRTEANVLVFALGVLGQANGEPVGVERLDGTVARLLPSPDI